MYFDRQYTHQLRLLSGYLVVGILANFHAVSANPSETASTRSIFNGAGTIAWYVNRTAAMVTFEYTTTTCNGGHWLGLGISSTGAMIPAPASGVMGGPWGVVQLSLDRLTAVGPIGARSLVGPVVASWPPPATPVPSGPPADFETLVDRPRLVSAGRWDLTPEGGCRLLFTRSLPGAPDPNDLAINPDASTWIIYSRGQSDRPAYHGPLNRGRFRSILGSSVECPEELETSGLGISQLLHGGSMFFGWGLACASGVFIARYFRHRRDWIEWHVRFQSVAATGTISAIMLAVGMVQTQLAHWHAILGTTITIGTVIQVGAGLFIHSRRVRRLGAEGGGSVREAWAAVIHKSLGRTLFVSAVVNAFEGLRLLAAGDSVEIALIVFVSLVGTTFLIAEVRLQLHRRSEAHKEWKQKEVTIGLAMRAAGRKRPAGTQKLMGAVQRARTARAFATNPLTSASISRSRVEAKRDSSAFASSSEERDDDDQTNIVTVESPLALAGASTASIRARGDDSFSSLVRGGAVAATAPAGTDLVSEVSLRELVTLLDTGVTPQLRPQVEILIALRLLTTQHDAILCLTPRLRHVSEIVHLATAIAALPNFVGSRKAIASLHADEVLKQNMVGRIATASASLEAHAGSNLVDSWWRPDDRLLDLCASATLLRHELESVTGPESDVIRSPSGDGTSATPSRVEFGMDRILSMLDSTRERVAASSGSASSHAIDWTSVAPAGVPVDLCSALSTRVGDRMDEADPDKAHHESMPVVCPFIVARGCVSVRVLATEEACASAHMDLCDVTTILSVAVQAGEKWTYMVPFPHMIESAEPGTCVIVFEPEAWVRYNSHDIACKSLPSRLQDMGNTTKSVTDAKVISPTASSCAVM